MARRAPSRGCCAGRRVSDARFGGHRRWPVSGIEVPDTGPRDGGSDGGVQKMLLGRAGFGTCLVLAVLDALLAAGFLATGSPGPGLGLRRSHHCSSWPRFCGVRERHARPCAQTRIGRPLNLVLPRHRCALACPRMTTGAGDGIGARSVARGGSAAEVGQQHRSQPFVIMVGGVRRVRYSPVQRVRGAATAQLSVEDPSRGLGSNSVTWGITGFGQSRPFDAVTLAADGVGVGVGDGVALVGVDPVVAGSEAFEGRAWGSQILARGAASGIADQDSNPEATIVLFGSAIRDPHAGRLNRSVRRLDSAGCDRVPGRFGVCCLRTVKQHVHGRLQADKMDTRWLADAGAEEWHIGTIGSQPSCRTTSAGTFEAPVCTTTGSEEGAR